MRLPGAIVVLLLVAGRGRAEDCPPVAIVDGDRALVVSIRAELTGRGVQATAPEGCPRVNARVERRGEVLRLQMQDDWGRSSEREIHDVTTATALIDSFTRQEVIDRVLASPPEPAAAVAPEVVTSAAVASAPVMVGVGLRMESSIAADRSTWMGGALSACVRVGPICAGGLLRAAADTGWTTSAAHDRYGIDLLATAELPLRAAGFVISPGLSAGVGWTRSTVSVVHMPDPHTMFVEEETRDGGGLRVGAHATIARPLGLGLALALDVGADGALLRGEGEPAGYGRAALGLRWGGW